MELVGEDAGAVQALDLLLLGRQGAQVRLDDVDDDQVGGRDGAESGEEGLDGGVAGLHLHGESVLDGHAAVLPYHYHLQVHRALKL